MKGDWKELKDKLKEQFEQLTDNDLLLAHGKKEELLNRLQIKLGKSREEIQTIISDL